MERVQRYRESESGSGGGRVACSRFGPDGRRGRERERKREREREREREGGREREIAREQEEARRTKRDAWRPRDEESKERTLALRPGAPRSSSAARRLNLRGGLGRLRAGSTPLIPAPLACLPACLCLLACRPATASTRTTGRTGDAVLGFLFSTTTRLNPPMRSMGKR